MSQKVHWYVRKRLTHWDILYKCKNSILFVISNDKKTRHPSKDDVFEWEAQGGGGGNKLLFYVVEM